MYLWFSWYRQDIEYIEVLYRSDFLKKLDATEKKIWGKKVIEQLAEQANLKNDNFIILAGQEYIKPIIENITHFTNPLKGLRQGERVKFLNDSSLWEILF